MRSVVSGRVLVCSSQAIVLVRSKRGRFCSGQKVRNLLPLDADSLAVARVELVAVRNRLARNGAALIAARLLTAVRRQACDAHSAASEAACVEDCPATGTEDAGRPQLVGAPPCFLLLHEFVCNSPRADEGQAPHRPSIAATGALEEERLRIIGDVVHCSDWRVLSACRSNPSVPECSAEHRCAAAWRRFLCLLLVWVCLRCPQPVGTYFL